MLVPGNHDAPLVRRWALARGRRSDSPTGRPDGHPRAVAGRVVAGAGAGAVRYPGVWLADRIWATHGHYLDRHLIPESAFGLPAGSPAAGAATARPPV